MVINSLKIYPEHFKLIINESILNSKSFDKVKWIINVYIDVLYHDIEMNFPTEIPEDYLYFQWDDSIEYIKEHEKDLNKDTLFILFTVLNILSRVLVNWSNTSHQMIESLKSEMNIS